MKQPKKQVVLYWLPRILALLFVGFLSLFALDVFNEYQGVAIIAPLLIHLIPAGVLLLVVALSWKHEIIGTITFGGFAIFYVYTAGLDRHWSWYVAISLPAAVIGILFFLSWIEHKKSIK